VNDDDDETTSENFFDAIDEKSEGDEQGQEAVDSNESTPSL